MVDLIIRDGKVVLPHDTIEMSIAVDEGRVVALGADSTMPPTDRSIDAKGNLVLPGCIDPHIHINMPFMGATTKDDFFVATKAASWGGTTTIIDFAIQQKRRTPMEAVRARREQADDQVVVDYSLHPAITDLTPETIDQLRDLIEYGVPSFKLYLVYRREGLMVDEGTVLKMFQETKTQGGLVGLHAENATMIECLVDDALRNGHKAAIYHALTRPPVTLSLIHISEPTRPY